VRSFGVVDLIEGVDLGLQLGEGLGERLLVQKAEQGLVEPLVLALSGRFVGLAGDRFDPEPGHVINEMADIAASGRFNASPLSFSSRCGTPWTAMALSNTATAASAVSLHATWDATA
jgi:hypothetical protein